MKRKYIFILLFVLLTGLSSFGLNGTAILLPATAQTGQDFVVPLMVTNFMNVTALTLKFTFDPAVISPKLTPPLNYIVLSNFPPGINANNFIGYISGGNKIVITCVDINGFSLPSGRLFDINFTALCNAGITPLNFVLSSCEVAQDAGLINVEYTNGSVTVNQTPPLTQGTVSADPTTICYGCSVTLTATPPTGGNPATYQYYWESSTNGGSSWSMIAGANTLTYVATGLVTNTLFHQIQTSTLGNCGTFIATTDPVAVTVNAPLVPATRDVPTTTIPDGQSGCFDATQTITVGGNGKTFTVMGNGSATFISGGNILFLDGVTVQSGGSMIGRITTTAQYCAVKNSPDLANVKEEPSQPVADVISASPKVYPNPTTGLFTLDLSGIDRTSSTLVEIYQMTGEKVISLTLTGEDHHPFNLERKPSGIYFLRAINGDKAWTFKIIKD